MWPQVAEHERFFVPRFEVGRDGKTEHERLKGKSAKVQSMMLGDRVLQKRKRIGGPLG